MPLPLIPVLIGAAIGSATTLAVIVGKKIYDESLTFPTHTLPPCPLPLTILNYKSMRNQKSDTHTKEQDLKESQESKSTQESAENQVACQKIPDSSESVEEKCDENINEKSAESKQTQNKEILNAKKLKSQKSEYLTKFL